MKMVINGAFGRMGKALAAKAAAEGISVVYGVDVCAGNAEFPVGDSLEAFEGECDVVVDFSHHSLTKAVCDFAVKRGVPAVICTTGQTDGEKAYIEQAAKQVAVFKSANMSVGIALLCRLAKQASAVLEGADVEIIEKHHNQKLDAPSGTALMLADAVKSVRKDSEYVYNRHEYRRKRADNEIGIHAVRAGNIVGEHELIFALGNETVTLSHSAASRELFADGAIRAARFMVGKSAGMYNMDGLIDEIK